MAVGGYEGWGGDHIGKLHRLKGAVAELASGSGASYKRIEKSSEWLAGLTPTDFPLHLHKCATQVLEVRLQVPRLGATKDFFDFSSLSVSKKRSFSEGLINLYEACLIDLGRLNDEFTDIMYNRNS